MDYHQRISYFDFMSHLGGGKEDSENCFQHYISTHRKSPRPKPAHAHEDMNSRTVIYSSNNKQFLRELGKDIAKSKHFFAFPSTAHTVKQWFEALNTKESTDFVPLETLEIARSTNRPNAATPAKFPR